MRKLIAFIFTLIFGFCKADSTINHVVYFDSGKSELLKDDQRWIDSVSVILKSSETYSIDIKGYCDADGREDSNQLLSKSRSAAVSVIFLSAGLDNKFIATNSFGEQNPAADNLTVEGKKKNRRVEIAITYRLRPIRELKNEDDFSAKENVVVENVITPNTFSSETLEVGKVLILKNMNFVGGSPILLPESEPVLKELLQLMKENPTLEIEIGGHVCCGPDYQLSLLRAKKVFTYLKGYGIDGKRMSYKGYSFDKPIAEENTEEGRMKNRRVEITILKL